MKKNEFLEQAGVYAPDIKLYLMSHLNDSEVAEDLTHDCLIQAAELYDRNKYDQDKPLKNWLFCMAYSRLVDYVRHRDNRRRHHRLYSDKIREALGWDTQSSVSVIDCAVAQPFRVAYAKRLLQTRFSDLPVSPAQRRLLQLRYVERLTYKQIAIRLGEPLSTVMSRHTYAMSLLRGEYVAACHRRRKHRTGHSDVLC